MGKIGLAQARLLLQRAALTQAHDFVYQDHKDKMGCLNVPFTDELGGLLDCDGWPAADSPKRKTGCVVGTALSLGGVDVSRSPQSSVWTFEPHLTRAAVRYLKVAQVAQDSGMPWGVAWEMAETWADNLLAAMVESGAYLPKEDGDGVCEVAENPTVASGVGAHGKD